MNRAMIIPIQPKFSKMIKDGLKEIDFRNYAIPKGSKVYIYESLGKKVRKWRTEAVTYGMYGEEHWKTSQSINTKEVFYKNEFDNREDDLPELRGYDRREINVEHFDTLYDTKELALEHIEKMKQYKAVCPMRIKDSIMVHEGQGKVVAESVVGECYEFVEPSDDSVRYAHILRSKEILFDKPQYPGGYRTSCCRSKKDFEDWGYTNQKFAHEITDLIFYDEDWQSEQLSNLDYDWVEEPHMIKKILNSPKSPLDISEFYGWNKLNNNKGVGCGYMNICCDLLCKQCIKTEYQLTHAPQGKTFVVEREVE